MAMCCGIARTWAGTSGSKGMPWAPVAEVLVGGTESAPVFLGQLSFVIVIDHDCEQ